jgi:nucleoside-diphosphate-sugar epimerase
MKVFVTGKNGFIAINLINRLKRDGHTVESSSQGDSIVDKLQEFKPDHIHHLAVEAYHPDKMVESNILLTHAILEYCRFNPVTKLILYGSSSEYGRKSHPMKETDLLEPETIYEGTKAAASLLARSYAFTYGIPTVIVRPMSVYGPHEKPHKVITRILTGNLKFLTPNAYHDWIYIDDFVNAILCIVGHPSNTTFDIVNVGTGVQRSNLEIHSIAESLVGKTIDYKEVSNTQGVGVDSDIWVCDPTHLKTTYGFTPSITLEDGMQRYHTWLRSCGAYGL